MSQTLRQNRDQIVAQPPKIRTQRAFVFAEPRNAIGWADLALAYFNSGDLKKAERALTAALQLAPNNRHVLRSVACYFVQTKNPEKANDLLNTSGRSVTDPWLAAAEIATASAASRSPKLARRARERLLKGDFAPRDIAELAGAVATLELASGSMKRSKKLFQMSLTDPNENAVAQVQWAVEHRAINIEIGPNLLQRPLAFEALARDAYARDEWTTCTQAIDFWMRDQPFLVQPPLIGSFIASELMDDLNLAIRLVEFGLRANPNNVMLQNNAAVFYARSNKINEAEMHLKKSIAILDRAVTQDLIIVTATEGLLAYRRGDRDNGHRLYTEALNKAVEINNRRLALRAFLHYIREEVSFDPSLALAALDALDVLSSEEMGSTLTKEFVAARGRITRVMQLAPGIVDAVTNSIGHPWAYHQNALESIL
jgi:Tfp pilus assembly protein PilF